MKRLRIRLPQNAFFHAVDISRICLPALNGFGLTGRQEDLHITHNISSGLDPLPTFPLTCRSAPEGPLPQFLCSQL